MLYVYAYIHIYIYRNGIPFRTLFHTSGTLSRIEDAGVFSDGLAQVLIKGKWGFIDTDGKISILPRFEEVLPFSQGLARVQSDGKWAYIDRFGDVVWREK